MKTKMINALKAFKIESPSLVKGGIKGEVSWSNGSGVCDIRFPDKEVCMVPDGAVSCGDIYDTDAN